VAFRNDAALVWEVEPVCFLLTNEMLVAALECRLTSAADKSYHAAMPEMGHLLTLAASIPGEPCSPGPFGGLNRRRAL
jgi:hypothetical protein